MATLIVAIEIPNRTKEEILSEPDWHHDGHIVVDYAYLKGFPEDDSCYMFPLLDVVDTSVREIKYKEVHALDFNALMQAIADGVKMGTEARGE